MRRRYVPLFDMNANGMARGPKSAPITPQNTGFAPRRFAIWWQATILIIFTANITNTNDMLRSVF